ncbi:ribokinase [Georgenia sp. EYE_87]|uniref:ribokinase n=1 Tax=Georgenia sp. EYE_87 TaxID=2853448 RepID=UPI00200694A3|nr:ribokinase [Georgenia sp. EYE_87]MCK6210219.1 ribokinase [Georgenia sp. EYE_87]
MQTPQVVVVGSANADLVLDIDHRPAPGETVIGSDVVTTPGGKGANQAVAAGKIGGAVAFVGCVGDDDHGALLRESLSSAGVDLTDLRTVDAPTGTATIMVTPDGENSIIVAPGANRHVTPAMLEETRASWGAAPVVVLQLEIPLESVALVAAGARGRVVVNAAPAARLAPEVLAAADPLVVNESEAAFLLEDARAAADLTDDGGAAAELADDAGATARALLRLGPRSVVLTLGAAGAVVAETRDGGAEVVRVPAVRVEAVDTTGAGDSFVGALAVELAAGTTLERAVRLATRVAAVAVTRRGAQTSFPTLEELERGGTLLEGREVGR